MSIQVFREAPHEDGVLVIFKEFPMTYICVLTPTGEMVHVADSIRELGREREFEKTYIDWKCSTKSC